MGQLLKEIAQKVYTTLNEEYNSILEYYRANRYNDNGRRNFYGINNFDSYNFATNIVEPFCEKYFLLAAWAKGNTKKIVADKDNDSKLHRAAFRARISSLDNPNDKGEVFKVLCKIYNPTNKNRDCILIDFDTIADGRYKYYATIIDGTCYYIPNVIVNDYMQRAGNSAVTSQNGKFFINVATDFWIDNAWYSYEMDAADQATYNKEFEKYIADLKRK